MYKYKHFSCVCCVLLDRKYLLVTTKDQLSVTGEALAIVHLLAPQVIETIAPIRCKHI